MDVAILVYDTSLWRCGPDINSGSKELINYSKITVLVCLWFCCHSTVTQRSGKLPILGLINSGGGEG